MKPSPLLYLLPLSIVLLVGCSATAKPESTNKPTQKQNNIQQTTTEPAAEPSSSSDNNQIDIERALQDVDQFLDSDNSEIAIPELTNEDLGLQ